MGPMPSGPIGTLRESPLHAALKAYFAQPNDELEAKVEGYWIDIRRPRPPNADQLIEIQTRNFSAMKAKVRDLSERFPIRIVHPIPAEKWLVRLDADNRVVSRRKSPQRGHFAMVFAELVSFPEVFTRTNLTLEVVLTREEERRRLRRNLHNSIGPTLAALNLRAGSVRAMISRDPAAAENEMGELRQQIRNIITDIRRVVYDLRPPVLDELGLRTALREQCAQFTTGGLRVTLDCPESFPPISAAVEVAAYRIVQEGLSNVARHSRAGQSTVRIGFGDGFVRIEVTDDGVGVLENQRAGVGLTSMRELAVEIGGTCVLEPAPGGGSRVRANLPMDLRAAERHPSGASRG